MFPLEDADMAIEVSLRLVESAPRADGGLGLFALQGTSLLHNKVSDLYCVNLNYVGGLYPPLTSILL